MNKKLIYIIIGIIVGFLAIFIIIVLITTNPINPIKNPTNDNISFTFMIPDSKILFYYDGGSIIKKWDLATNQVASWIEFPFANIDDISYSPDGSQALVYWSDPNDLNEIKRVWLVDLKNKKIVKEIGQNILSDAWSPDSQKIVYQNSNQSTNQYELIVITPSNGNQKTIANLSPVFETGDIATVLWPNAQTIIYFPAEEVAMPIDVKSIDLTTLQQKTILSQIMPNIANTVISQNKILFSFSDPDTNIVTLTIYSLVNGQKQTIDKNDLFLVKTAQISNTDNFYSAWRAPNQKTDSIIRFSSSGQITMVTKALPGKIDAENLMSPDTKDLYFFDGNQLYHMKINL